jgi:hypothetical protein
MWRLSGAGILAIMALAALRFMPPDPAIGSRFQSRPSGFWPWPLVVLWAILNQSTKSLRDSPLRGEPAAGAVTK